MEYCEIMIKSINVKKNTIANYLGQFYTIFIGIFMLPFYLEYLGAEEYGMVGFFTLLTSIMLLLDMGFSQTLTRETANLKDKLNGTFEIKITLRSIESMIGIFSILIFIGIFFSSTWIASTWLQIEYLSYLKVENCIKLIGFIIIIRWYVSLYNGVIIGFEQQIWLNIYKIFIATLRFVGGLVLIIYITNDIYHYFIYQAIIAIIEFIILHNKVYINLPKTKFIIPSFQPIKKIASFALGLGYVSGIWIIFTQLDKMLLSHYIPLENYAYFVLVITISNAIMQFSTPLSQAILPRMSSLLSNGKEEEMIDLYKKSTQFMSIIVFSVVSIIGTYSYELLYSWTGNIQAAIWASPVLFWYSLGNGILAISAFQYYLQYAHGNLKYHIKFNTYFALVSLPIIYYSVSNYGAIGAGKAWFIIQLIGFIVWPTFIHAKFARGLHSNWLKKDIFPALLMSTLYVYILKQIDINFEIYNRIEIFFILIVFGIILLFLNAIVYRSTRDIILKKIRFFK
ncbi:hypothetical protein CRU92_09580 [Arcobacter sp. FW59]|nr:hypothetical protein CRU92_09580 [Arcobacter sp. FW59]